MKMLIVYYSYSGNNESLARELRSRFGSDLIKIKEPHRRTGFTILVDLFFDRSPKVLKPDVFLSDYETIIFLGPIWDAKIATPLKSFIQMERDHINSYAFITVCGGREGQMEKVIEQLQQLVGKRPIAVAELGIRSILSTEMKNDVKTIAAYRLSDSDLGAFKKQIQNFVNKVFSYSIERVERKPLMEVS